MGRHKTPKPSPIKAVRGVPTCPAWLGKEGKTEWKRITKELQLIGLLSKLDRACLVTYCEAWEEFISMVKQVRKEGVSVMTMDGGKKVNPSLKAKQAAADRVVKIAAQFGMTPAARTKIEAAEADEEDEFAKFTKQGLRRVK